MKPKERFLNYALFPTSTNEPFKEDIPIDLSTKKPSPVNSRRHPYGLDFDPPSFPHSPPHINEWAARYCFPNLVAKHYGYPPSIFPYLFINPLNGSDLVKARRDESLYDPFALPPYHHRREIFPFKLDPYHAAAFQAKDQQHLERPPPSTESSSPSSSSSPYNHGEYPSPSYGETRRCSSKPPSTTDSNELKTSKGSHSSVSNRTAKLKKSLSFPCLAAFSKRDPPSGSSQFKSLRRTKSECNLHLIKSYSISKIVAPKKLFASNYNQNKQKQDSPKECNNATVSSSNGKSSNGQTRFYRNYRKEVIECWDNENRDTSNGSGSSHKLSNGVLDLRMKNASEIDGKPLHYGKPFGDSIPGADLLPQPVALDLYRQYYYYLIQEPAFASRAAVAVAETYAKLLSSASEDPKLKASSPEKADTTSYEPKRTSPDFILSKPKAELRSADTTNGNLTFDRKRISRPLTGKHVRHGTGASPSTLVSLRNMIQQRQKLKEIGKFNNTSRYTKGKINKRIKRK